MAIQIKSLAEISAKWQTVASGAASFYEAGIRAPRRPWATSALNAASNFRAAISAGNIQALYEAGIRRAGDSKWSDRAINLGRDRFTTGVNVAQDDYEAGFSPYHAAIARLDLPKRQPRGSEANLDRVRMIARELHAIRVGRAASR